MTIPDPIIPLWFDAAMWLGYALTVALAIVSIVLVARAGDVGSLERTIWIVAIVVIPVLGPIAWFVSRAIRRISVQSETASRQ